MHCFLWVYYVTFLITKKHIVLNFIPKYISNRSIGLYFISLIIVSGVFLSYAMYWYWILFGVVSILFFTYFSGHLTRIWSRLSPKKFSNKIFWTAFLIRVIYVIFSYYFFIEMTGAPFEFAAGDSMGYHYEGVWIVDLIRAGIFGDVYPLYIQGKNAYSDMGYPLFLGLQYLLTNKNILIARIIKALLSAFMCVIVYKISVQNFGEAVARIAAIFILLMPNLIMYCGMHLKETEMIFIMMAYIERTDYLLRSKKFSFLNITVVLLLIGLLFLFRTVLGIVAIFALVTALLFSAQHLVKRGKRWIIGLWVVIAIAYFAGGTIALEVENLWQQKDTNQQIRLEDRAKKGNVLAKYAGASIFAPLIFTLPFPTMVETPNQETFRMLHGGVFVKNVLSFFTILALYLLLIRKKWRENVFIIAFLIAYLGILTVSAFAHSERFHLPAVPLELIFAAFGITQLNKKYKSWFNAWTVLLFFIIIIWSWFKLKGRGYV